MRWLLLLIAVLALSSPAVAHNEWSNGGKIPDWVKSSCCGPNDAHHLRPEQVYDQGEYYVVDGYQGKIPHQAALPSQDGDYWIFYACPGPNCSVFCFFVPMAF